MSDENEPREWRENREAYLKARAQAGTLEGTAYARRLEAMRPAEAAAELAGMYSLCFDEDLAGEIASELQLDREKARAIAAELVKLRGAAPPINYEEIDAALHQGDEDGERSEVLKKEKG
jgi:hypothetical protein